MTIQRSVLVAICVVGGLLGAGCDDDDACADEQAELARLNAEVDALIVAEGCQRVEDCRASAFGAAPCGGPARYATYCTTATDTVALGSRRADLERQARHTNEVCELPGPCVIVEEPTVALEDGRCVSQ